MAKVIELSKRFNDRWKTDKLFLKDFDYDHPKYANVPDDIKWMIPLREAQKSPEVIRGHAEVAAQAAANLEKERRQERLKAFKKLPEC